MWRRVDSRRVGAAVTGSIGLGLFVLALTACSKPAGDASSDRPHVILILADDLGRGDVGFTGGDIPTPHLDAFAETALVLERCYAAPMCSPARAQLLTGRHALGLGVTRNFKRNSQIDGRLKETSMVSEQLAAAGYRTAMAGKWHLGERHQGQGPNARGFDSAYGHLGGWIHYTEHRGEGVRDWHRDGRTVAEPGYSTDLIAAEAERVIRTHTGDEPLFLFVSFNAPHTPLQAPPGSSPPMTLRGVYSSVVEHLDQRIGDVIAAVDELESRGRDALVFFASDNGAHQKYGGSNGELRGGKYGCDEGSLRVPAAVRWRGTIAPGRTDSFVGFVDVAPTLATLAGAPLAATDGTDITPLLEGRGEPANRPLLFAVDHARVQRRAALVAPWKLVIEERESGRLVRLHDVVRDPFEREDLAEREPEKVRELEALLAR